MSVHCSSSHPSLSPSLPHSSLPHCLLPISHLFILSLSQSHPIAVRYALAGAKMLSHVIATGEPSFNEVTSDLKKSADGTDKEIASVIETAAAAVSTPHTEMVKKHGLACSKRTCSCHIHVQLESALGLQNALCTAHVAIYVPQAV